MDIASQELRIEVALEEFDIKWLKWSYNLIANGYTDALICITYRNYLMYIKLRLDELIIKRGLIKLLSKTILCELKWTFELLK